MLRSSRPTKAFGAPPRRRVPEPAATTMTARRGTGVRVTLHASAATPRPCPRRRSARTPQRCAPIVRRQDARTSSSTNARTVLVGLLGQSELRHEDLARLGQHALLARRQTAVLVAAPQVANDLADLDDVARRELLEVRLVATRPVGRLLGERRAQHVEDAIETLLADHVTDADEVDVVGRDLDDEVSLGDVELQVLLRLALDNAFFDLDDRGRAMVRVNDGLANLKKHGVMSFRQHPGYHRPACAKVPPTPHPSCSRAPARRRRGRVAARTP